MALLFMARTSCAQTWAAESVHSALSHFDRAKMAEVDKLIGDAISAGNCPGAVLLIGRGDDILHEKAYGNRAIRPQPLPMTADTVFDLASLTKPVATASSILWLAEQGKIRLEDPVAKYLPTFAAGGKDKITIADLLLHVGGLTPDNAMADYADGPDSAMGKILLAAPLYPHGTRFAYSDVGYIVLAEMAHRVDGRPIDRLADEEIFAPLQMTDTGYLPPDRIKSRCAATEIRSGHWMQGEVHDPRSFALGGIAGHAGLFSTARDLSRFCRMILAGGTLDGRRILRDATVARWIEPRPLPGGLLRTYGFDVDTPYSTIRGDRFERGMTFGHTGFTGTAVWIDPINRCYFILLMNSVHPDGKGKVTALRHDLATAIGEALLGPRLQPEPDADQPTTEPATARLPMPIQPTLCGIDILKRDKFQQLAGGKIGLITNQTGRDRDGHRTIDLLAASGNLKLVRLFSPEHGIDGVLDEKIDHSSDAKTGLKIFSLYGKTQSPTPEMLDGVDTLVFDIQDVGTRFYTYISTMGLCMKAAAGRNVRFVVLDRPNPNTGLVADGPPADAAHLGFTAFAPLPLVHGMTVGEVARYFNGELKIGCDLRVIRMENWRRRMWFDETGLTWINPSPNLRNPTAALLYPAIGLLESTNISMGRGTDRPFEQFGAPWIDGPQLAAALGAAQLPGLSFEPITFQPQSSKFSGETCRGVHVRVLDRNVFEPARSAVAIAWIVKHEFGETFQSLLVEKMLQNSQASAVFSTATKFTDVPPAWASEIATFRAVRVKYLLYQY